MADTLKINLQNKIFDNILLRFPKKSDAIDAIAHLLDMGKDSVYRRLRGDTFLTPDELVKLARHFHISIDAMMFDQTDTVFFIFNMFSKPVRSFEDYVEKNSYFLLHAFSAIICLQTLHVGAHRVGFSVSSFAFV